MWKGFGLEVSLPWSYPRNVVMEFVVVIIGVLILQNNPDIFPFT